MLHAPAKKNCADWDEGASLYDADVQKHSESRKHEANKATRMPYDQLQNPEKHRALSGNDSRPIRSKTAPSERTNEYDRTCEAGRERRSRYPPSRRAEAAPGCYRHSHRRTRVSRPRRSRSGARSTRADNGRSPSSAHRWPPSVRARVTQRKERQGNEEASSAQDSTQTSKLERTFHESNDATWHVSRQVNARQINARLAKATTHSEPDEPQGSAPPRNFRCNAQSAVGG